MATSLSLARPVGQLLREWRERRRMSQLDLALDAEISTRHLSFVETGRSVPSREMVIHLAEQLDLPLRDRNHLLLAAGYAPVYAETPLDAARLSSVRAAVRQLLHGHEPFPAIVVDGAWNLIEANSGLAWFTEGVAPDLLAPPANALRFCLHPEGMAPRIVNLGEYRAHILSRLRRHVAHDADPKLARLYDELRAYPCDQPEPEVELPGPSAIFVPLHIRRGSRELVFFSTIATFGTPLDITVAELVIESFFPADPETAAILSAGLPAASPGSS